MDVIDEAVKLNHALVHQPNARGDLKVRLRYDLLDYWRKVRDGEQALLRETIFGLPTEPLAKPQRSKGGWSPAGLQFDEMVAACCHSTGHRGF